MIQVSENIWRGKRPATQEDLGKLKDLGITQIINLETFFYEAFHNDFYKTAPFGVMGINEVHIPLTDVGFPRKDCVDHALRLMNIGEKTFVHCLHGQDRTGIVCGAQRLLYDGWAFKRARDEMFSLGFHRFPYYAWVPWLWWNYGSGSIRAS